MKKTKLLAILRRIVLALAAIVFGVRMYAWNAESLVGNRMPMPFGYGMAVVLSGSMEPALSVNDLIVAKETEEYEVGDMVVYQDGDSVVVHRVVTLDEETVQTKGDANNVVDAPISREMVKGKVIAYIPGAGYVVNFLRTPVGIFAVLAAAVTLMELSYRKEKQKDDDELERIKAEIRKLKDEE
ncbi:MAG: signal peptidase I [Lachnospiraceae bacterium]|nr:signal peptidase I [Lachnospiraceae bacterium]